MDESNESDQEAAQPEAETESDLETVGGVGESYASRLRSADVPSVTTLADAIDVSEKRVRKWAADGGGRYDY